MSVEGLKHREHGEQGTLTWVSAAKLTANAKGQSATRTEAAPPTAQESISPSNYQFASAVTPSNSNENQEYLPYKDYYDNNAPVMAHIKIDDILGCADFEKQLKDKLLSDFRRHGVPENPMTISMAAYTAHVTVMEKCREEWAKIPTYRDAKARGESSSPLEHFDKYWRKYLEAEILFQHILRQYDAPLISDIRNFVWRTSSGEADRYLPPTKKQYHERLSRLVSTDWLSDMYKLYQNLAR